MKHTLKQFFSPLRGNLLVLVVSLLIWTFMEQMIKTYEPLYVFALGGTGAILGALTATQTLLGTSLRIPGGYIADTRGRRLLVGAATILASFAYLFYALATNWTWLIFGVSLLSLTALSEPALDAIRADSVGPEDRGRSYVLLTTLPQIPALIAPTVGGLLILDEASKEGISLGGVRTAYFLLFLGILLAGLIRLFFLKETFLPTSSKGTSKLGVGVFRDAYETIGNCDPSTRRLVVLTGFFMFCFHFDERFRSAYAVNVKGLSTVEWGMIVTISQIVSTMAIFAIGWSIDKYGRKKVFVPSIALLGVSAYIFTFSNSFTSFLLAMIVEAIFLNSRIMALQVLMADSTPMPVRGRVFGTINILSNLGSSASIVLSGILYDIDPVLPFHVAIVMYALATLAAMKFLKEAAVRQV